MRAATGTDRVFTSQLGITVHAQRAGCVIFTPRPIVIATEHVVGGIVHQRAAGVRTGSGDFSNCIGIDALRQMYFVLRLVHGGIRHRIDHRARLQASNHCGGLIGLGKIGALTDKATRQPA
jgi:hypothetical protein